MCASSKLEYDSDNDSDDPLKVDTIKDIKCVIVCVCMCNWIMIVIHKKCLHHQNLSSLILIVMVKVLM